ncbi:MAG: serpin family protein [Fimbriiglobus sp.]
MLTPLSRRHFLALVPLSALAVMGCSDTEDETPIPQAPKDEASLKELAGAVNQFGLDLYGQLRGKPQNLFLSPMSIMAALGMTATGARGETLSEMTKVLHLDKLGNKTDAAFLNLHLAINQHGVNPKVAKARYTLETANAIWGQKGYPWLPEFKKRVSEYYRAGMNEVDFITAAEAARKTINGWVEKKTHDKIKDLIPEGVLTNMTRMVLTNAIYFLGNWAEQFEKGATRDQPFHLADGTKIQTPMMSITKHLPYAETEDYQAVSLPYKENALAMIVLLPRKKDGLADLEAKLTPKMFELTAGKQVGLFLPRFKFEAKFSLPEQLQSLGMKKAFKESEADFSGMLTVEKLFITDVIHQAYVDVNEQGTEAAAATAVMMAFTGRGSQPKVFLADHPFVFAIRHQETGALLFLGRCENPKG